MVVRRSRSESRASLTSSGPNPFTVSGSEAGRMRGRVAVRYERTRLRILRRTAVCRLKEGPSRTSDVEAEVGGVPVLHDVLLDLEPQLRPLLQDPRVRRSASGPALAGDVLT